MASRSEVAAARAVPGRLPCGRIGEEEVPDDADLRVVHQRRRMAAAGDLDRADLARPCRGRAASHHLARRVSATAGRTPRRAGTSTGHSIWRPTAATARCRAMIGTAKRIADGRIEVEAKRPSPIGRPTLCSARCAPLRVASASPKGAWISRRCAFDLVHRVEAPVACPGSRRCGAAQAAETRAPKSLSTSRRIGVARLGGDQHADVPAQRCADPVDLLDIESSESERRHGTGVGPVGVVRRRRPAIRCAHGPEGRAR